jgi:hypothetical protein
MNIVNKIDTYLDEARLKEGEYDIKEVLAVANAVIKAKGYIAAKNTVEAGVMSTKSTVLYYLKNKDLKLNRNNLDYADNLIDYFRNSDSSKFTKNDFEIKCYNAIKKNVVDSKSLGFVVAATLIFDKVKSPVKGQEHVGKIGDKITIEATLLERRVIPGKGYSGIAQLYKFVGEDNNSYVTFHNGIQWLIGDDKIGKKFRIKGQITKHSSFKTQKDNVLKMTSLVAI